MNQKAKYTCIIIDDEPIAIKLIKEHLEKIESLECINSFTKALNAIELVNTQNVDLIFLDINMPGISGVEFLRSLQYPPKVIFTTAYRNFAVDAFELDAIDYLIKPISFERFLKSINKFLANANPKAKEKPDQNLNKDYIILKADKKNYKLKLSDILYFESLDNYVKVYTNNLSIICYESLANLENRLSQDFLRIHRSYIVNLTKIDVFTSSFIEIDKQKFTIGRNYKKLVNDKLNS